MEKINYLVIKNLNYAIFHPVVMMVGEKYLGYDFKRRVFIPNPALNGSVKKMLSLYKIVNKQEALDIITVLEAKNLLLGEKSDT